MSVLFKDETGNIRFKGQPCFVSLTNTNLKISDAFKPEKNLRVIDLYSLVVAKIARRERSKYSHKLEIIYFPPSNSFWSKPNSVTRSRKSIKLNFGTDKQHRNAWANAINRVCNYVPLDCDTDTQVVQPPPKRKMLVIVNPISGGGKALRIWRKQIKPVLLEAGIEVFLEVTKYVGHANALMKERDSFYGFEALLSVGGDGLLCEVVNGIGSRDDGADVLKHLPLMPIPCGSGNGLMQSVLFPSGEELNVTNAVLTALKGTVAPLDLCRICTYKGDIVHWLLTMEWGLVADVGMLSTSWRIFGKHRFTLGALYFSLRNKPCSGTLKLKLAPTLPPEEILCASSEHTEETEFEGLGPEQLKKAGSQKLVEDSNPRGSSRSVDRDGWISLEGEFHTVWILLTSHATAFLHSAPSAALSDGLLHVLVMEAKYQGKPLTRLQMMRALSSIESGAHVNFPFVQLYHCTEYELEPNEKNGFCCIDGEFVKEGALRGIVLPSAARVLVPRKTDV